MGCGRVLIFCAGGNPRTAEIAVRYGFLYGSRLPETVYQSIHFADQEFTLDIPKREPYMKALAQHRPALATVLDLDERRTFEEVMSWADEAAQYVSKAVIVIPKVSHTIQRLPRTIRGKDVRLGYSVPTDLGGTNLPVWDFSGWPVHLLGGQPHKQIELAHYMNVVSADTNYHMKQAMQRSQFFTNGEARYAHNRFWPQLHESVYGHVDQDAPYFAFELSCMNILAAWSGCKAMIRWAVEADLSSIQRIAKQYDKELGWVRLASLRESLSRRDLLVAEINHLVVGFCNGRRRRDGIFTVYEIAVDRQFRGLKIGTGLLAALPRPIRLKCTMDNSANIFYERLGFKLMGTDQGRKRPLNIWQLSPNGSI